MTWNPNWLKLCVGTGGSAAEVGSRLGSPQVSTRLMSSSLPGYNMVGVQKLCWLINHLVGVFINFPGLISHRWFELRLHRPGPHIPRFKHNSGSNHHHNNYNSSSRNDKHNITTTVASKKRRTSKNQQDHNTIIKPTVRKQVNMFDEARRQSPLFWFYASERANRRDHTADSHDLRCVAVPVWRGSTPQWPQLGMFWHLPLSLFVLWWFYAMISHRPIGH